MTGICLPNHTESDPKILSSSYRHRTSSVPQDSLIHSAQKSRGDQPLGLQQTLASDVEESRQPTHPKLQWYKEVRDDVDKSVRRTAAADQSQPLTHPPAIKPTDRIVLTRQQVLTGHFMEVHPGMDTPRRQGMFQHKHICIIYPLHQQWRLEGQLWQLDKVPNNISSSRTRSKPLPSTWDVPASTPKLMVCFLTCYKCRDDHTLTRCVAWTHMVC